MELGLFYARIYIVDIDGDVIIPSRVFRLVSNLSTVTIVTIVSHYSVLMKFQYVPFYERVT